MLTRSSNISPQQEYYADSLLTMPTASQTVFHNLAMGVATPVVALNMLNGQMAKKPEGKAMLSAFNSIRLENETPGMSTGQWLAGEGANMLGFGLNPATWGLGEAGGLAAEGLSAGAARIAPEAATVFMRTPIKELVKEPIGRYIPSMIGKEGSEKALSTGLIADTTLKNFGIFAGAAAPQGIVDNYKADTNHIEWGGVAREMGEMGAFGIAIGSIPFAWGVLRGKVNRGLGRADADPVDSSALDEALSNGHITPAEHQWYTDYLAHQKDPGNAELKEKLETQGSHLINENGHTANTVSNEAMFEIMTPDDVSNLQGVIGDQLSGNVPEEYRTTLTDFIIHNRLDYIRQNPKWLDGVRGYVDFINNKLANRGVKSAEADEILEKNLTKGTKESMPFSQKELFKYMKQAGFESSHMQHLPVTIPENMTKHLKIKEKIDKLKEKVEIGKKKFLSLMKKNEPIYYRGKHYKSIEELRKKGIFSEEDLHREDIELGKGFWFAESKEHAKKYGSHIEEIQGNYKLFDVESNPEPELTKLYDEIHKRYLTGEILKYPKPKGYILTKDLIEQLRSKLKEKGYVGIKRTELLHDNYSRPEVMFFESPKKLKSIVPGYIANKQTLRRIDELEKSLPKILTPKEELIQLRQELLGKGLKKNFERSSAYHRLLDLSNVWHNARTLLDRVHLEHEYNKQQAFRDLAHQVLKVADSDMPRISKPENVIDYMRRRIEGTLNKVETLSEVNRVVGEHESVPTDADAILSEQGEQFDKSSSEKSKQEFNESADRFREFKESEGIFKTLISCVFGGMGG